MVVATRVFQQRLHQREFRERVVRAYQHHCAVCRLRRNELLDAAHIMPDADRIVCRRAKRASALHAPYAECLKLTSAAFSASSAFGFG